MKPMQRPREQKRQRREESTEPKRPVFPEPEVPPLKRDG